MDTMRKGERENVEGKTKSVPERRDRLNSLVIVRHIRTG